MSRSVAAGSRSPGFVHLHQALAAAHVTDRLQEAEARRLVRDMPRVLPHRRSLQHSLRRLWRRASDGPPSPAAQDVTRGDVTVTTRVITRINEHPADRSQS